MAVASIDFSNRNGVDVRLAGDDPRTATEPPSDPGIHRRDLVALGAVAALGTAFGASAATASRTDSEDDELEASNGLFRAALTGDQQPDPVETTATGVAVFGPNEGGRELEYALLVSDVEDAEQAHVHLGPEGEDGPVVAWLYPGPDGRGFSVDRGEDVRNLSIRSSTR